MLSHLNIRRVFNVECTICGANDVLHNAEAVRKFEYAHKNCRKFIQVFGGDHGDNKDEKLHGLQACKDKSGTCGIAAPSDFSGDCKADSTASGR
ncbi:hypothetical protein [Maridesulfovibrio ferrireducens]|uniref:hypothetical protein n=1 Tax=Maridesulfovibrio ferrireducens TaxID=246191 RepID=UPI001A308792|nr:hypothetical protein [Maridesulfovibrio ferrireducens]MBI9110019.1 hypothetical protein [Maridesulfovibrio ferrireducens]